MVFNHRLCRCFCRIRRLLLHKVQSCLQYISPGIYGLFESCLCKAHVASSTSSSVMFSTPEYGKSCAHFASLEGRLEAANTVNSFSSSVMKGTSSEVRSVTLRSIYVNNDSKLHCELSKQIWAVLMHKVEYLATLIFSKSSAYTLICTSARLEPPVLCTAYCTSKAVP